MKTEQPKNRKKKVKSKQQLRQEQKYNEEMIVQVPKGKVDVVADFITDFWEVITPEMLCCLKNVLIDDMGLSKQETDEFIENLKNIRNEAVRYDQQNTEKKMVFVGSRNQWIKEVSKNIADQLASFVVETLLSNGTNRTKKLSEKVLEHLCVLTGENVTLESATTRVEKTIVVVANSLAKWIDGALVNIEKRTKCTYNIMSKPSTPECKVTSIMLSDSDDEFDESEYPLYPRFSDVNEKSQEEEIEEEDKEEKVEGVNIEEEEEDIYEVGEGIEDEEQIVEEEEQIIEEEEQSIEEEEEEDEEVIEEDINEYEDESVEEEEKYLEMKDDAIEIDSKDNDEGSVYNSMMEDNMDSATIKETEEISEHKLPRDSYNENRSKSDEDYKEKQHEMDSSQSVENKENQDREEEEDAVIKEDKENVKELIQEEEEPAKSPSIMSRKEGSLAVSLSSEKDVIDILDLLQEDMKRLPKVDKISTRQKAVKEIVYDRFKNIAKEKNKTSLDTLMKYDIEEVASLAANWVESVLPTSEPVTPPVRQSSAFEIKQYGSKYEALKLSYNTVAERVANLRGINLDARKDKYIPQQIQPATAKPTSDWATWALGATNLGNDWGKWLGKNISELEERLQERQSKTGKDGSQSWANWKIRAEKEAQRWRANNRMLREEGNLLKSTLQNEATEKEI